MQITAPSSHVATAVAGGCIVAAAVAIIRRIAIGSDVWALNLKDIPPLSSVSCTLSLGSIAFQDEKFDLVTEEGLKHSDSTLEARFVNLVNSALPT